MCEVVVGDCGSGCGWEAEAEAVLPFWRLEEDGESDVPTPGRGVEVEVVRSCFMGIDLLIVAGRGVGSAVAPGGLSVIMSIS